MSRSPRKLRIVRFAPHCVNAAAALFAEAFRSQRLDNPLLSSRLEDPAPTVGRLAQMAAEGRGVAAFDDGRMVGYLAGWWPIERFRGANRTGAYVPEWAHGAVGAERSAIYRTLYGAISGEWAASGCDVHAITLLAGDSAGLDAWFRSGFGMGTVDALRPMIPFGAPTPDGTVVRMATSLDAPALARLDVEHHLHYEMPPVFMAPRVSDDQTDWNVFLSQPDSTAWLAEDTGGPFGFIRFDANVFGGAASAIPDRGVFISGAYVRPDHRGRGNAAAILDAGLRHYAGRGFTCCALDFESFNPEATAFWLRYFRPVCYSLMRVPEWRPAE